MAAVRYRCQSCGGIHEISRRFDGTTYLRCVVTGQWAWHDPSALLPPEGAEGETQGSPQRRETRAGRSDKPARRRSARPARAGAQARRPAARRSTRTTRRAR